MYKLRRLSAALALLRKPLSGLAKRRQPGKHRPKESRQRLMSVTVENLKAFIEGKPVNVVH
jgi:hypothetical protein